MMTSMDIFEALPSNDEDWLYDQLVTIAPDTTAHLHHTNDGPILRLIAPMSQHDEGGDLLKLAYDTITLILSETTNNDACDVTVREISAHLAYHDELAYLNLPDDFSVFITEAFVSDYMS
jgi:hypothetical protein